MKKSRYFYFDNGAYGMGEEPVGEPQERQILIRTSQSLVSVGTAPILPQRLLIHVSPSLCLRSLKATSPSYPRRSTYALRGSFPPSLVFPS